MTKDKLTLNKNGRVVSKALNLSRRIFGVWRSRKRRESLQSFQSEIRSKSPADPRGSSKCPEFRMNLNFPCGVGMLHRSSCPSSHKQLEGCVGRHTSVACKLTEICVCVCNQCHSLCSKRSENSGRSSQRGTVARPVQL